MNDHVLLHLLNGLGIRDKMRDLSSILSLFRNNSKSFQMVNDEFRQGIKSDFSINETDDAYTVKLSSSEYTVSKDVNECSCLCFSNFGLKVKRCSL